MHGGDPLLPWPLLIFLGVIALGGYVLHATVFGRYLYAIGGNREAAAYSGIPVKRIETTTYVISAGLAGVAGVCYAAYIGQMSQQVGVAYELYAIAAVVLGGCSLRGGEGTVLGIVIGSAMMKVIDNGINMFQVRYQDADGVPRLWRLDANWTFIIVGSVILIAVVLDQVVHVVQAKRRLRPVEAAPRLQPLRSPPSEPLAQSASASCPADGDPRLEIQEEALAGQAAAVAGHRAVGADDAVAGDDDGDRVAVVGAARRRARRPAGRPRGRSRRRSPCPRTGFAPARAQTFFETAVPGGTSDRSNRVRAPAKYSSSCSTAGRSRPIVSRAVGAHLAASGSSSK